MSASDFFTAELGLPKDTGSDYRYNCPFCGPNDDHKLYLNVEDGKRNGLWHCFKCGAKGNPPSFVMKLYGISFKEALDELEAYDYSYDKVNLPSPQSVGVSDEEYLMMAITGALTQPEEAEKPELKAVPLPTGFKLLRDNLSNPEAYPFLAYAKSRGFTLKQLLFHNVGYVINSLVDLPTGKQLPLINHLVFLTHDFKGNYIYWNTRAIGESYVKSFNAPGQDDQYSKRTCIFNLNQAVNTDCIVINEGVPDALTVGESGVATFGKQLTKEQVELIVDHLKSNQRVYILLDNDAKDQIVKLARALYTKHKETYIVLNPSSQDANDMGHDKVWELIKNSSVQATDEGLLQFELSLT